jgi:PKD domain
VSVSNGVVGRPVFFSANVFDSWSTSTVTWGFGDGAAANGSAVSHTYTTPGTYRAAVTAVDAAGNQRSADATVTIGCAPPPTGTRIDAGCNSIGVPPTVTNVAQSHTVWREGTKTATLARRAKKHPPIGTTFTFSLNTSASLKLVFAQIVDGRKVAGKCLPPTKRTKHGRVCKRTVTAGTLTFSNAHSGTNKIAFQGRLSHSKRLPSGRYTLTITATNANGRATGRRLTFTIVNR